MYVFARKILQTFCITGSGSYHSAVLFYTLENISGFQTADGDETSVSFQVNFTPKPSL